MVPCEEWKWSLGKTDLHIYFTPPPSLNLKVPSSIQTRRGTLETRGDPLRWAFSLSQSQVSMTGTSTHQPVQEVTRN